MDISGANNSINSLQLLQEAVSKANKLKPGDSIVSSHTRVNDSFIVKDGKLVENPNSISNRGKMIREQAEAEYKSLTERCEQNTKRVAILAEISKASTQLDEGYSGTSQSTNNYNNPYLQQRIDATEKLTELLSQLSELKPLEWEA